MQESSVQFFSTETNFVEHPNSLTLLFPSPWRRLVLFKQGSLNEGEGSGRLIPLYKLLLLAFLQGTLMRRSTGLPLQSVFPDISNG
jgi:hypothetical protein